MFSGSEIGQLSNVPSCEVKHQMECTWTIEDIFTYTVENSWFCSPNFFLQDSEWYLMIYPNGTTEDNCVGWISLFLFRDGDKTSPKYANYGFGVKKACGAIEQKGKDMSWVFGEDKYGFGRLKFLERSELRRRKSELTSSDALTLTCSLSVIDDTFYSTNPPLDTLSKNFADLYVSKRGCDVTLKVQRHEFPVHKCILSARSAVFAAMFESEMKEKETGVVDIVDCDPGAFEDFLTYLYCGKFRADPDKALHLYKIADKYCVLELKSVCVLCLLRHLTVENLCDVVVLGDQFDDESLKDKTQLFFNSNFVKIIRTAGWKSLLKWNRHLGNQLLKNMESRICRVSPRWKA